MKVKGLRVLAAVAALLTFKGAAQALQLLFQHKMGLHPTLQLVSPLHLLIQMFLLILVTLNLLLAHLGVKVQGLVKHQRSQLVILVTLQVGIATQLPVMVLLLLHNL